VATRTRSGRRGSSRARPPRRRSGAARGDRSDLGARVVTAIPAIAVALFLVIEGGAVFALGLFVLGCVCMHELFAMYQRAHPVRLAGYLALAGLLAGALYGSRYQVLLAAVCSLPVLFLLTLLQRTPSLGGLLVTLLGIYWIGFALAHAVLLRQLPHGLGIVIDVLVGTFLGDTGAYLGGRLFGRYQDWLPTSHALVLGVAVALAAPLGDLFESFVKREAGVKDSGSLFGAHGGALDRLDAVLFTAVVGYYVWAAYVH